MNTLDDAFLLKHVTPETGTIDFTEKCRLIQKKTHIKLNNKGITDIGEAILCRNSKVLFLQDNYLNDTTNLKQFCRLTHLYLQNNWITRLDGFEFFTCLVKLYLGSNRIAVLENLENCQNLEEIHIGNQHLAPTEKFIFDPRTIEGLAESLLVLDVSTNRITSIKELENLTHLEILDISSNDLEDVNEVAESIKKLQLLHTLTCGYNPMCSARNYKGILITAVNGLKTFNGSDVSIGAFSFYKTLHSMNVKKKKTAQLTKLNKILKQSSEHDSPSGSSNGSCEESQRIDENAPLIGMEDIKKIIQELPTGLRTAISKSQDYTEHIDIINKQESLRK